MLKLLVTGLMVYLLYRYFFGANSLGSGQQEEEGKIYHRKDGPRREADDDGDYIDYEEVD
ncbi:MAG: hypothetical protein GVY26_11980 [Bacteroidetes bacterium]|jgi:hypothetical protein|nr:hypothetical protein [Bacteroidota bacterium]